MTSQHLEIERKYEMGADVALPDLRRLPKVSTVEMVLQSTLEAIYSDTADLALADAGITLRRRTGGSDAGWHLKLPLGGDDRAELAEPLKNDEDGVPPELLRHLRAWVRDRELRPVATLSTRRVVHRLIAEDKRVLAEVSDDIVTATATPDGGDAIITNWREWEIELVDGTRKLLTAADELFAESGAFASIWPSKLHHALDRQSRATSISPSELTDRSTAGAVINAYLADQVAVILTRDSDVRLSAPDAVHKARVATRRLRSALSTFRPLFHREVTDPIRGELKWLASALGGARDAEVQREHLLAAVAAEPDDLVLGPVAARIEVELRSDYRAAHDALLQAMDSVRYFRLLDTLEDLVAAPPFTVLAAGNARSILRRQVRHVCKNLYALAAPDGPDTGPDRDAWLHEIRKAAKRVRYAAEATAAILGKSAAALAATAEDLQEILGEHQDSVVTRATLRGIGVRMHLDGENSFTIGRLHALQQARADAADATFRKAWSSRLAEHLRVWRRK